MQSNRDEILTELTSKFEKGPVMTVFKEAFSAVYRMFREK
jgi:hypothetical protein